MSSEESTSLLAGHENEGCFLFYEHDNFFCSDPPANESHAKMKQIHDQIKKRREEKDETLNEQEYDRYLQEVSFNLVGHT
jgi:hypothetical protein